MAGDENSLASRVARYAQVGSTLPRQTSPLAGSRPLGRSYDSLVHFDE